MLYAAIIGAEPPSHPEIRSFAEGFNLSCRNGFKFSTVSNFLQGASVNIVNLIITPKVPRSFSGGANAFFTLMWTSAITGYESISDHISFLQSPAGLDAAVASVAGDRVTVQSLIEEFLQGSGIPCPAKFDELKGGFNTLIDLDKTDTPGFRARVFTWAATGSPAISPDDTRKIAVSAYFTLLLIP